MCIITQYCKRKYIALSNDQTILSYLDAFVRRTKCCIIINHQFSVSAENYVKNYSGTWTFYRKS